MFINYSNLFHKELIDKYNIGCYNLGERSKKVKVKKEVTKMGISDKIEAFICELIKDDDGWVELGRNELAGIFNCVPSQINYVMQTRFTPQKGYIIESRRGGGGYIKIRRILPGADFTLGDIPESLNIEEAQRIAGLLYRSGLLSESSFKTAVAALGTKTLSGTVRADVLKEIIKSVFER